MSKGVPHGEAHRAEPEEAERNFKPNQQHQPHIDRKINKQTLLVEIILFPDKIITFRLNP